MAASYIYMIYEYIRDDHYDRFNGGARYDIYKIRVDHVDDDDDVASSSSSPVLRLSANEYPLGMAFFSLGFQIFMVGGMSSDHQQQPIKLFKDVFIYDTTTSLVEKSQSCMVAGGKQFLPLVISSPHHDQSGKIYVLSGDLSYHDLESYDPNSQSWSLLPPPPVPLNHHLKSSKYQVIAHAMVDDHTIVLSTISRHVFFFHISTQVWSKLGREHNLPFFDGAEFVDGAWFAFNRRPRGSYIFPLYSFHFDGLKNRFTVGSLVKKLALPPPYFMGDNMPTYVIYLGDKRFCFLRVAAYDYGNDPSHLNLNINVFRLQPVASASSNRFSAVDQHCVSYKNRLMDGVNKHDVRIRACLPVTQLQRNEN